MNQPGNPMWFLILFVLGLINSTSGSWIISPQNSSVLLGDALTLGCHIGNSNGEQTRWFRNGFETQLSKGYRTIEPYLYAVVGKDEGLFNLQIKHASRIDNTSFTCTNVAASPQNKKAYVFVIEQFDTVEITPLGHNRFSCDAKRGNPGANRMLWKIDGVEVSSAEPWSTVTDNGYISSSSVYEVGSGTYHGEFTLTCNAIQSNEVKSVTASFIVTTSHGGANREDTAMIIMIFITVMIIYHLSLQ